MFSINKYIVTIINILKNIKGPISYFKKIYPLEFKKVNDYCLKYNFIDLSWSEVKYLYSNNITSMPKCDVCGGSVNFYSVARGGYAISCNIKCAAKNPKTRNKFKATNLLKYGYENHAQSKMVKDKMKATNLLRYGVEYASSNKLIAAKISKNSKKNWPSIHPYIKNGINNATLIKNKEILNILDGNFLCLCDNNHRYITTKHLFFSRKADNLNPCTICNDPKEFKNSFFQKEVTNFIKSIIDGDIIINYVLPNSKLEADIYIKKLKLAIECNGIFWHSEKYAGKHKHLRKLNLCESNNIKLIQIWEDDWNHKKHIVKSMLSNIISKNIKKIYADKCEIKTISSNEALKFLTQNHLSGNIQATHQYGLYYKNELISMMIFKKLNRNNFQYTYEMLRFCNKLNLNIINAESVLFDHFLRNIKVENITARSNRDWPIEKLFNKLNFKTVSNTSPDYFWAINNVRYNRYSFRKGLLRKEGFDINKTGVEIMISRKYYKVFNSGNKKLIYNV